MRSRGWILDCALALYLPCQCLRIILELVAWSHGLGQALAPRIGLICFARCSCLCGLSMLSTTMANSRKVSALLLGICR
jgi:hypothetical protein